MAQLSPANCCCRQDSACHLAGDAGAQLQQYFAQHCRRCRAPLVSWLHTSLLLCSLPLTGAAAPGGAVPQP